MLTGTAWVRELKQQSLSGEVSTHRSVRRSPSAGGYRGGCPPTSTSTRTRPPAVADSGSGIWQDTRAFLLCCSEVSNAAVWGTVVSQTQSKESCLRKGRELGWATVRTPRARTLAAAADNSRSNTKMDNKGQRLAKKSILLLLGLVFTHGKDLLQYFLDIFIHLALRNANKRQSLELKFSPGSLPPENATAGWDAALGLPPPIAQSSKGMSALLIPTFVRGTQREGRALFSLEDEEAGSLRATSFLGLSCKCEPC